MRFEVLTTVGKDIMLIFWVVTPCSLTASILRAEDRGSMFLRKLFTRLHGVTTQKTIDNLRIIQSH
jgi:hypothetical protein